MARMRLGVQPDGGHADLEFAKPWRDDGIQDQFLYFLYNEVSAKTETLHPNLWIFLWMRVSGPATENLKSTLTKDCDPWLVQLAYLDFVDAVFQWDFEKNKTLDFGGEQWSDVMSKKMDDLQKETHESFNL